MSTVTHHPHPAGTPDQRPRERGAVLIIVVLFLAVALISTTLTVDIGRVSAKRHDLQTVADVISLDLEHQLDGHRTTDELSRSAEWRNAVAASRHRNKFDDATGRALVAVLGHFDPAADTFTPTAGGDVPDAVQVTATDTVDYDFAPGSNRTSRQAIASQGPPAAGLAIDGSPAPPADEGEQYLVDRIIGGALDVNRVALGTLAGGPVPLTALVTKLRLDLGHADAALSSHVGLADLIHAEANVLHDGGDTDRAAILDSTAKLLPSGSPSITLGQLFDIKPGGAGAAKAANVDALQLLVQVALAASGGKTLTIPDLPLELKDEKGLPSLQIQVDPHPGWVFGPIGAAVQTNAAHLVLWGEVDPKVLEDSPAAVAMTVTVDVPSTTGTIRNIGCGSTKQLDVDTTATTTTADTHTTGPVGLDHTQPNTLLATVDAKLTQSATTPAGAASFSLPPDVLGVGRSTSGAALGLTGTEVTAADITIAPGTGFSPSVIDTDLPPSLQSKAIAPMLAGFSDYLSGPLAHLLGISAGGSWVTPLAITCGDPQLVG